MSSRMLVVRFGAGVALVLLALLAGGRASRSHQARHDAKPDLRAPRLPPSPSRLHADAASGSAGSGDAPSPTCAVPDEPTSGIYDGFVVHAESGGLRLHPQDEVLYSQGGEPPITLSADSARRFESLNLGGPEFSRWIEGHGVADQAPRVWVRVRGIMCEEASREALRRLGITERVLRIHEILEVDALSDAWIAEFQRSLDALHAVETLPDEPPSHDKRERFRAAIDAADGHLQELARLHEAGSLPEALRGLPVDPEFERRAERDLGLRLREQTEPFDLVPADAPQSPGEAEVRRLFLGATDQAGLRESLVSRFGENVLEENLLYFEGTEESGLGVRVRLRIVLEAWSLDHYREVRDQARGLSFNSRPDPAFSVQLNNRDRLDEVSRAGLEVQELGPAERQAYLVKEGALVRRVLAGSRADDAGLRVGDIVWRVTAPTGKQETSPGSGRYVLAGPLAPATVRDADSLGFYLQWSEELERVTIAVLRDGRLETRILKLR